jgi:1,4-dihydroxy-2-naphthoate polyprenyltransferase
VAELSEMSGVNTVGTTGVNRVGLPSGIQPQSMARLMARLMPWLMALRPKTLSAAIVPVLVGTALVRYEGGEIIWWVSICALLSALLIQIGTNFVNDAVDFRKGADTAERIGPQRVTQSGLLTYKQVMFGAGVCFGLAFALGIPLVFQGGWPIVLIGLVSLALGYAYTGGPFPLAYLGLGDLFVILFFGLIAVGGTFFLHTHTWSLSAIVAGLQVGSLATVLIAINNLRDAPQDAKVGKMTLAVRLGLRMARVEILILTLLPFALGLYWALQGHPNLGVLPMVALPLARRILFGVFKSEPSPIYNQYLAMAGAMQILFGVALAYALMNMR